MHMQNNIAAKFIYAPKYTIESFCINAFLHNARLCVSCANSLRLLLWLLLVRFAPLKAEGVTVLLLILWLFSMFAAVPLPPSELPLLGDNVLLFVIVWSEEEVVENSGNEGGDWCCWWSISLPSKLPVSSLLLRKEEVLCWGWCAMTYVLCWEFAVYILWEAVQAYCNKWHPIVMATVGFYVNCCELSILCSLVHEMCLVSSLPTLWSTNSSTIANNAKHRLLSNTSIGE